MDINKNLIIAAAIINEAETWAQWIKSDFISRNEIIAADDVAVVCKRFRKRVIDEKKLDELTDISSILSQVLITLSENKDRMEDLLIILKEFSENNMVQSKKS